jgi:hypothetical protein
MSPQQRIRVMLSDGQGQQPDNMVVLFRQRVVWVMLLGSFLALLCLPAHRQLFLAQVEAVRTRKPPAWTATGVEEPPDQRVLQHRARLQATLRRHLDDARLHLGVIPLGGGKIEGKGDNAWGVKYTCTGEPAIQYAQRLRTRFPHDPLVLGVLMRLYCEQHVSVRRPEGQAEYERRVPPRDSETRLLTPAVVRQVEAIAAEGERVDPGNAFLPAMLAVAYFGAGQDEQGLRMLHRAAERPRWEDYSSEEVSAGVDLLIRTYGDQSLWMHVMPRSRTFLRYFHWLRSAALVAEWQARRAGARGDLEQEHRVRADLIQLGGLLRRQAWAGRGGGAGAWLQERGFGVPEEIHPVAPIAPSREAWEQEMERQQQERDRQRRAYLDRVRREAPHFVPLLGTELEAIRQSRTEPAMEIDEAGTAIVTAWNHREVLGLAALANGLAFAALALVLGVVPALFRWRRQDARTDGWTYFWTAMPVAARVTLLAITPFVVLLLCDQVVPLWSAGGWQLPALVFGFLLLPVFRRKGSEALAWTGTHGLLVALLTVGVAAIVAESTRPWGLDTILYGYWREASAGHKYVYNMVDVEQLEAMGARWLLSPAPLLWCLPPAGVLAAAVRRASTGGAVSAVSVGAKTLTGVLGAAYIVYLLLAVPANQHAVRTFEALVRQLS